MSANFVPNTLLRKHLFIHLYLSRPYIQWAFFPMNFQSDIPQYPEALPVTTLDSITVEEFQNHIHTTRAPAILRGCDIGTCRKKWTSEYLKTVNPEKKVKVHRSTKPELDFRHKNFSYETITFRELIENCQGFDAVSTPQKVDSSCKDTGPDPEYCSSGDCTSLDDRCNSTEHYFWYLRSLGEDPRGKDISDLSIHFPELYSDLQIPQVFKPDTFFSSVFRITSAKLQLWTHYDTCDNILIQVRGRKRIIFFPPSEALNLYLDGDKSEVLDVENPDFKLFPNFFAVQRYEAVLEEGDIVFIPALWFHNVKALDFSVSVNVFWKNLESSLYDKKDTYGNKDLVPAQLGFATLNKAVIQLNKLPEEYRDFYLRRMIISLQKKLDS